MQKQGEMKDIDKIWNKERELHGDDLLAVFPMYGVIIMTIAEIIAILNIIVDVIVLLYMINKK